MAKKVIGQDPAGELLSELISNFSIKRVVTWLERKFASFDTSKEGPLSVSANKNDARFFKSARILGFIRDLPDSSGSSVNCPVLVAAVEMKNDITERTSRQTQFNFAKRTLQEIIKSGSAGLNGYPSQGIFFFYDKDQFFRISLVSGSVEGRRFKFNEAKRQSFFINPDRPNNVAKSRLQEPIKTFNDLKKAFSVETLTKEFYSRLFEWYEWAMKPKTGVTFPNDLDDNKDDRKYNNESIIRLITRLMFTWFIRQRGLVPEEFFSVDGVKSLLKKFDPKSMEEDNYYRCILQNLFFATLNCQSDKRGFRTTSGNGMCKKDWGIKTLYRYEKEFTDGSKFKKMMRQVPFLNCALFDCLDKQEREEDGGRTLLFDGFSDTKKRQAHVPNGLFFHPEKGIITLFDTYEFTIDENNADDADVALDPELLGKVFENLLGAFNPETSETARKSTGSFYTPREIVDYMVEESLKNYLKTKVPSLKDEWLQDLFDKTKAIEKDELPFDDNITALIRDALYSCKILDPACGSGAFPMGILHCMVRLFGRLDPNNCDLNDRLIARYKSETNKVDPFETASEKAERLEALKLQLTEGQHYPDYARKLYLIENCIYGVDIQPIATQISKLRFFISLLCDQLRSNWNEDIENQGLLSLPNLEAKFVCANTLISLPETEGELKLSAEGILRLREKLQENRHRIFSARTYQRKNKLKERDQEIRDEIRNTVRSTLAKPDKKLIAIQEELIRQLKFDRKRYESAKMVKKLRPQQGSLFDAPMQGELCYEMVDENKEKRDAIDEQIRFAEKKIDAEYAKASAANGIRVDELASKVAGWDPYDQNASSEFFDPMWMFNIKDGFDVVIGNPPYGATLGKKEKEYCAKKYISAQTITGKQKGSLDTFSLFVEKAYNCTIIGGNTIFILPMSIVSSASMTALHNLLYNNCEEIKCSSYAVRPQPVFENAFVNTTIFQFKKTGTLLKTILTTKMHRKGLSLDLSKLVKDLEFVNSKDFLFSGRIPKIGKKIETEILRKVLEYNPISNYESKNGVPLYYRGAGGRYFKVITNYSTKSSAEKEILVNREDRDVIGCVLSSSLSFWFYQIYSDNLNWKIYEIGNMRVPVINKESRCQLEALYNRYLDDIESHANIRKSEGKSSYHVNEFKEYKIGYSKKIIDEIDDFIGPLYGLTREEIEFIKNYEIEFRMADYWTADQMEDFISKRADFSAGDGAGAENRRTGGAWRDQPGGTRRRAITEASNDEDEELE